jgi:membrane associated rhomboid family serine protease
MGGKSKKRSSGSRPAVTDTWATFLLIALNIGAFFYLSNYNPDKTLMESLVLTPHNLFVSGEWQTLITSGFVHKNVSHLFFNMVGIFIFGSIVENRFGAFKTVLIYFLALVLSMLISAVTYTFVLDKNVGIIGASGAVMGLISCAMLAEPFTVTYEAFIPVPVMIKGWMFFYADMKGFLGGEKDGISHLTHLAGFLSMSIIIYFLDKKDREEMFKGLVVNVLSFVAFFFLSKYLMEKWGLDSNILNWNLDIGQPVHKS